ncbi:hypothetical protein [Sorangium sp. So ce385]|uniref:hypothetical protein n=1 Tax=Sorangium sp. So ce385 TaxID=3133308 RepID=UPI003F5B5F55
MSNASSVGKQRAASAAGPAWRSRPSTAIFAAALLAVGLAARPSAATPPCKTYPIAKYSRQSAVADVLQVTPSSAWLCDVEPKLHATRVAEQHTFAVHCESARCKLDDPAALDASAAYLLRDEAGQVLFARWGEELTWGVSLPPAPEPRYVTAQRLRLGPSTPLVGRPELFLPGRSCFSLPPDQRLEPGGVYLVTQTSGRPAVVLASLPEAERKPVAPAFTIERDEIADACHDHGVLWFVPKEPEPNAWFVWDIYARDGETRIVGPVLGPVPWVVGSERPPARPAWALELERDYVLSVRALDPSGNLSDEQRLSFTMERTGRSRHTAGLRDVTVGADMLAAVVFTFAVLAAIWFVVKAARPVRDPTRADPSRAGPAHDPSPRPGPPDPG